MKKLLFSVLASCLIFSACDQRFINDLDAAKLQWDTFNAQKYAYTFRVDCECIGTDVVPARIVVENDIIVEILDPNTNMELFYPNSTFRVIDSIPSTFKTIPDLFEVIENALENNPDDFDVNYDETNGFPTSVSIDYLRNAIDDEITYSINNFEKIN